MSVQAFEKQYEKGRIAELEWIRFINDLVGFSLLKLGAEVENKYYDCIALNEVKAQNDAEVCFMFETADKHNIPSGVVATKSPHMIFQRKPEWWVIPTEEIRKYMEEEKPEIKWYKVPESWGFTVPLKIIIDWEGVVILKEENV